MIDLAAADLLRVWERGQGLRPFEQAILLLQAACPERALDELLHMSIGQRDTLLLALRERLFGDQLTSLAACPQCDEQLKLNFGTQAFLTPASSAALEEQPLLAALLKVRQSNYEVHFRLPTTADLIAISKEADTTDLRQRLLTRCIATATYGDESVTPEQLPAEVSAALSEAMAQADPQAEIRLSLSCPSCSHQWLANFDITTFLWSEIRMLAIRLVHEVHLIASAYGWREGDILALTPLRRQYYLQLIRDS